MGTLVDTLQGAAGPAGIEAVVGGCLDQDRPARSRELRSLMTLYRTRPVKSAWSCASGQAMGDKFDLRQFHEVVLTRAL